MAKTCLLYPWKQLENSYPWTSLCMQYRSTHSLGFALRICASILHINLRSWLITITYIALLFIVTGEANFLLESTRLTVGGFTQPGVARNLMDLPSNAEKGLSHRFLWVFPKPLYGKFDSLEKVDKEFQRKLGKL